MEVLRCMERFTLEVLRIVVATKLYNYGTLDGDCRHRAADGDSAEYIGTSI
jgi:hypothetical protein